MRNPLTLAWWILILGVLEGSSLILDRSHHLLWAQAGFFLLKVSYLAFASVLMLRFLSFRTRKTYETMVDSYNRISGQSWSAQGKETVEEWRKFLFYMALIVVASTNIITPMAWGDMTFKTSIGLDLIFWLMALRWVTRAHWLKALGRKEKLKEGLDDARSLKAQAGTDAPPPMPAAAGASPWPFFTLFILAVTATVTVGATRFRAAERNYILTDLKGCMLTCLDRALDSFHREGRLEEGMNKESCLLRHREDVEIGMGFQRGELLLWAVEKPGHDYFWNGKGGDQGLMLDAEGRFRDTGGKK